MKEEMAMLRELLRQDQFEPASDPPRDHCRQDIRVVYLMNDAAESFLVFCSCIVTGTWPEQEGGPLEASFGTHDGEYTLIIRQGSRVLSLFYRDLQKEVHLYNYAVLGHFWVSGWEYLRNLEYHLAILRDKRDYLGADCCTEQELELAVLTEFPPLNYCCYPAAPKEYVIPAYPAWKVSGDALKEMRKLSEEARDPGMLRMLSLYRRIPSRFLARHIARMFRKESHAPLTDLLLNRMAEACADYPDRKGAPEDADKRADIMRRAAARQQELLRQGIRVDLLREEAFTAAQDSIQYQVYLMIWGSEKGERTTSVESFSAF